MKAYIEFSVNVYSFVIELVAETLVLMITPTPISIKMITITIITSN